MDQLNLFEDKEDKKNDPDLLPTHHMYIGGGNIQAFLKQQYLTGYTGAKFNPIPKPKK